MGWFSYTVANIETVLVTLKLLGIVNASWLVVLAPVLGMVVISLVMSMLSAGDEEEP